MHSKKFNSYVSSFLQSSGTDDWFCCVTFSLWLQWIIVFLWVQIPCYSNITLLLWHVIVPWGILWRVLVNNLVWSVQFHLISETVSFTISVNHMYHLDKNLKDCYQYDFDWSFLPDSLRKVSLLLIPFAPFFYYKYWMFLKLKVIFLFRRVASLPKSYVPVNSKTAHPPGQTPGHLT